MPRFIFHLLVIGLLVYPPSVKASNEINNFIPGVQKVGEGEFRFIVWPVYHAELYAPNGQWQANQPFALRLSYLTDISGKDIAETSIKEIRRLGKSNEIQLAAWYEQMSAIFPDVKKGSSLTGIKMKDGRTFFLSNDKKIGKIEDPAFSALFFAIWLDPRTQSPSLRAHLLGLK